jgi:ribosomal protein S18 acetylase RimI-like enzyme
MFNVPGVTAYHNDKPIGYLTWARGGLEGMPGEIQMVKVHPQYQRHGIATGMLDFARQADPEEWPEIHHSEDRTYLGDQWAAYEQGRSKAVNRG